MKRSPLKRSTKPMKRGGRLKSKAKGRHPYAQRYYERFPQCQICAYLDGELWLSWCERDGRACTETSPKHVHHVFAVASRWDSADGANYATCCERSHAFIEQRAPYYGRLVCAWAKLQTGTFNRETVLKRWDRDPVSVIHGDLDGGRFEEGTDGDDLAKHFLNHF